MEGNPELPSLKVLVDLGFGSNEEIQVAGQKFRPREFLTSLIQSRGLLGYPTDLTPNDWR